MKILGLFRHAKSDWHDAKARDFDRPLNQRGRKGARIMGRQIVQYGQTWDRIIASPAVRSAETIEIASGGAPGLLPINWDRRVYLASSATLLDVLRELDSSVGAALLVGHNPGLEDVIFDLVPDDGTSPLRDAIEEKFPTAAFAVLELDIDDWADLAEGTARFVHLKRPRDVDPELGPELID
ncbi:MAG: histidine phosphatase family protein [Novosphingobium sp.]